MKRILKIPRRQVMPLGKHPRRERSPIGIQSNINNSGYGKQTSTVQQQH
jgi:hypothetical protein